MKAHFLPVLAMILSGSLASAASTGPIIREEGAIYLEDQLPKLLQVTVETDAPIYYDIHFLRYLGTLRKGQSVELQAISDQAYRVRGNAQQGQVAGWVQPENLSPLEPSLLANLRANADRKKQIDALIAQNEVAINMTPEEVMKSLGKPQKKTARLDAKGQQEVWEYVRYKKIPKEVSGYDGFGRLITNFVYEKVAIGQVSIVFDNNLVSSMEQSEGTLDKDARAKIVTAPLVVE